MSPRTPNMSNLVPLPSHPSSSSSNLPDPVDDASSFSRIYDEFSPYVPKRLALWHPEAGLVVSPNMNYVPKMAPEVTYARGQHLDPPLLKDKEVYIAFRPRFANNTGDLFGRLNLNREALNKSILPLRNGKYILDDGIVKRWSNLENALLDMVTSLLTRNDIPSLTYPKFPWEYGYRIEHASHDITLRCALRSRDAFMDLATVVTFALSLYMDDSGSLDAAYRKLMSRSISPVHAAWLDLLAASYVCNFSEHFRVGGVIDPYQSRWVSKFPKFVQARVPIWILWGHNYLVVPPIDKDIYKFLPPQKLITDAELRSQTIGSVILPTYRYDPYANNQGIPNVFVHSFIDSSNSEPLWDVQPLSSSPDLSVPATSTPSVVVPYTPPHLSSAHSNSVPSSFPNPQFVPASNADDPEKQALEALEEYFANVERRCEARRSVETPVQSQQRISREKLAEENKYSKKSAFYLWRDIGNGFYVREKVNSKQVEDEWCNHTRNQRRFWGYLNEWDFCPQLPKYSDANPKSAEPYNSEDDSGDEFDQPFDPPARADNTIIYIPDDRFKANVATVTLDDLNQPARATNAVAEEESDYDRLTASHVETFSLESCLRDRFGYDLFSPQNWKPEIVPAVGIESLKFAKALMALSFQNSPGRGDVQDSVVRLLKILSNTTWRFSDLPASFDHSMANSARLSLKSDTLAINIVTGGDTVRYLVHKRGHIDQCPWAIATSDASTVLLIFRKGWTTVEAIAQELVQRGVPFNTVAALERPPLPPVFQPTRGLGSRPENYKPTSEDYFQYLRVREDLLKGPKGRAALLHGGIIGRIARDVLEPSVILDGPSSNACIIDRFHRFALVDDQLTENDMNIICGVYYVKLANAPADESFLKGTRAECSWWPQDSMWNRQNAFLRTEWSELAEAFYQNRLNVIKTAPVLLNASRWSAALRKANTLTKMVERGAEHYQAGFLEDFHRQTLSNPYRR